MPRKRTTAPTGADETPTGATPDEHETPTGALVVASLAEESEHEEITRAVRVYADEVRASDEHGNVYAIQREQRADGTQGPREIAKVVNRQGTESRQGLRFLAEYGAAARAFRGAGVYVFPRFLDDLAPSDLATLSAARESEQG